MNDKPFAWGSLGGFVPLDELELPDADCDNCEYMALNNPRSGGHCYMFKEKPGLTCGQFKKKGS